MKHPATLKRAITRLKNFTSFTSFEKEIKNLTNFLKCGIGEISFEKT